MTELLGQSLGADETESCRVAEELTLVVLKTSRQTGAGGIDQDVDGTDPIDE